MKEAQNLVRQLESVHKAPPKTALKNAVTGTSGKRTKAAEQRESHLLTTLKAEIKDPKSDIRKGGKPTAVMTGSTNWTDGAMKVAPEKDN
jgi:hypothetical protein